MFASLRYILSRSSTTLAACQKQQLRQLSVESSKKLVVIENRGKVRLIGINRPEKRNCVNHETALELREAFDQFEKDDDSVVAVLHGIGGTFCAGYDLSELAEAGAVDTEKAQEVLREVISRGPMVSDWILVFLVLDPN